MHSFPVLFFFFFFFGGGGGVLSFHLLSPRMYFLILRKDFCTDPHINYIEDITRGREDMNFIFEWQNNQFYERAQRVSKILFFTTRK